MGRYSSSVPLNTGAYIDHLFSVRVDTTICVHGF